MACDTEQVDAIEACRTCGIYYMSTTNYLKPLFHSALEYPEMMLIRLELAQWNVEISESDGLPQYLCSSCIHEFQKVFKFRSSCIDTQDQLRAFYNLREENLANLKIKTEILDANENADARCDFIYVDDFSDGEYDSVTPFNIPHVPIKVEQIEAAKVPQDDDQAKPVCKAESAFADGSDTDMSHVPTLHQPQNEYIAPSAAAGSTAFVLDAQIPKNISVECKLCHHISPNPEEHKQHTRRVHENRDMECHICGKVFKNSTQNRFKFHLKWHNINKHVKCPQCGFVCSSRQGLKEHKRAVHAKIYCKICGKGVLAKKMKGHLRGHEIVTQFPCEYCTEVLSSEKERETHIWQIHANEGPYEKTNQIDHLQNLPKDAQEHANTYGEVVNVEVMCAQCDEKFVHQSDLELHVKLVHFNPETQRQHLATEQYNENAIRQNILQTSPRSMIMHRNGSSPSRKDAKYKEEGPENQVEKELENEKDITEFEDYDDEDSLELPQDSQYMRNLSSNDKKPYFTQIHSDIHIANYQDDDDEVTIEHFGQQECANEVGQETGSDTESETEIGSNSSFIPNDIPQFACAKCTDTFTTVDKLREHYENHQLEQNKTTPTKAKFECHICDKQFDLKFSLNRHILKHKSVDATE